MYRGNSLYFELKRKLIAESKNKLANNLYEIQATPQNPIYVIEWLDLETAIVGYGCDKIGDTYYFRPNITPGLFVVSNNLPVLSEFARLHDCAIIPYKITYRSNNFKLTDLFLNPNIANKPTYLVKIVTNSTQITNNLFYALKNDDQSYKFAIALHYYDPTKQIMFELFIRELAKRSIFELTDKDYKMPEVTGRWFDRDLNCYDELPKPEIPLITFDIETVSIDPHRLPTGDDEHDILYSVSIHHVFSNTLYSLIYLPLRKMSTSDMKELVESDGYQTVPVKSVDDTNCKNILECYASEYDLLDRTMNLLHCNNKLHYLIGYNSINYDIKYLLMRCAFYNIHLDRFVWREGYCFGWQQLHLDLQRIIVMRYRFKSYTLNAVSQHIIKDSKTGVDAVALRYAFFRMYKHNRYFKHEECNAEKPSVRDTIHYNNADTLLVSKLVRVTDAIEFLIDYSKRCQVPLSHMNSSYNKMQYKLWNECSIVGLNMGIFLGTFKSSIVDLIVPMSTPAFPNNFIDIKYNMKNKMNTSSVIRSRGSVTWSDSKFKQKKTTQHSRYQMSRNAEVQTERSENIHLRIDVDKDHKFPGGANFCLGEFDVDNVQMYDYVTAYPLLMDRKNISDETVALLPANILLLLYNLIQNKHEYTVYDYVTHHGDTCPETIILYYQYIYNGLYCGGQFEFTTEELYKRHDALVIIIWHGRRGILSDIVAKFSDNRALTKVLRKALENAQTMIEDRKLELRQELMLIAEYNKNNENNDEDSEENDINDNTNILESADFNFDFDFDDGGSNKDDDDDGFFTTNDQDECKETTKVENKFNIEDFDCNSNDALFFDNDNSNSNDFGDGGGGNNTPNVVSNLDFQTDFECIDGFVETTATTTDSNEEGVSDDTYTKERLNNKNSNVQQSKTIINPYGFSFCNNFITIYENQTCVIDDEELMKLKDPMSELEKVGMAIEREYSKYSNSYDLQKNLVSSIYGCVGKMIPVVAAVITCITRSTLLKSAQYCRSLGNDVYYIDTDSIMISSKHEGNSVDLSSKLNSMYPYMEMEMKVARKCLFVKRKTYYKLDDGHLKYGQNVNGPQVWRECVNYFYNHNKITNNDDIYNVFVSFFDDVYKRLLSYSTVTPEFIDLFSHTIKLKEEYKTLTVTAKLKEYLRENYPQVADAFKQKVFYYLNSTSTLLPVLRPTLDITTVDDLPYVNLFKYYQNMYTTIFNIIKFHIKHNNQPYNVTISSKYVLLLMLSAYLDVYQKTFKNIVPVETIDRTTSNPDNIFDKLEYLECPNGDGDTNCTLND